MLRNTRERWGSVSIGLHWAMAGLLLVQVPVGLAMQATRPGAAQNALYFTHKNLGLLLLLLVVARLGWRALNPVPKLPSDLPQWQSTTARATHLLLYAAVLVMGVSGYLYTALGGFPVLLLGLADLGRALSTNEFWAEVFKTVHVGSQWVLYVLVTAHVAAALWHHFGRRDELLRRMLSSKRPLV